MNQTKKITLSAIIGLSLTSLNASGAYTDADTDYTKTTTESATQFGPFNPAITQQNFVLCKMHQSGVPKLYKPGSVKRYSAKQDALTCSKDYGKYQMWSGKTELERHLYEVDASDITNNGIVTKVWVEDDSGENHVKVKVTVTEGATATNPNGLFTMVWSDEEDTFFKSISETSQTDGWNRFKMTDAYAMEDGDDITGYQKFNFIADTKTINSVDNRRFYMKEFYTNTSGNEDTSKTKQYAAAVQGDKIYGAEKLGASNWTSTNLCFDKSGDDIAKLNIQSKLFYKTDTRISSTDYNAGEHLGHSNKIEVLLSSNGTDYNIPATLGRYKLWEHSESSASAGTPNADSSQKLVLCESDDTKIAPSDLNCKEGNQRWQYTGGEKDGTIVRAPADKFWVWAADVTTSQYRPSSTANDAAYTSTYKLKLKDSDGNPTGNAHYLRFNGFKNLIDVNTASDGSGSNLAFADSVILKTTLTDVDTADTNRSDSSKKLHNDITFSSATKTNRFYKYADGVLTYFPTDDQDYLSVKTTLNKTIIPLVNIPAGTEFTQVTFNSGEGVDKGRPTTSNTAVKTDDSGNAIVYVSKPISTAVYANSKVDTVCSEDSGLAALLVETKALVSENRATIPAPGFTWGSKDSLEFDKANYKVIFGDIQYDQLTGW